MSYIVLPELFVVSILLSDQNFDNQADLIEANQRKCD